MKWPLGPLPFLFLFPRDQEMSSFLVQHTLSYICPKATDLSDHGPSPLKPGTKVRLATGLTVPVTPMALLFPFILSSGSLHPSLHEPSRRQSRPRSFLQPLFRGNPSSKGRLYNAIHIERCICLSIWRPESMPAKAQCFAQGLPRVCGLN